MPAICLFVLFALSLDSAVFAAERSSSANPAPTSPVQDYLQNCIGHARVSGTVLAGINSIDARRKGSGEHERIFAEAKACVEAKFKPALDDAAGDADLTDALMAYHKGVLIWIQEASQAEGSKAAYKAKEARIDSEFSPLNQKLRREAQRAGKLN